jgi:hypothetical protein
MMKSIIWIDEDVLCLAYCYQSVMRKEEDEIGGKIKDKEDISDVECLK